MHFIKYRLIDQTVHSFQNHNMNGIIIKKSKDIFFLIEAKIWVATKIGRAHL